MSPTYPAGLGLIPGKPGNGFSMRFPRFLRVRDDKETTDATTPDQLLTLFTQQQNGHGDSDRGGDGSDGSDGGGGGVGTAITGGAASDGDA